MLVEPVPGMKMNRIDSFFSSCFDVFNEIINKYHLNRILHKLIDHMLIDSRIRFGKLQFSGNEDMIKTPSIFPN